MPEWFLVAQRKNILARSFKVALVVGTVLNGINQFDGIVGTASFSVFKAVLTYCVPFCVATYGAVTATLASERT